MPLSIRMEFYTRKTYTRKPTKCTHPTLRDVEISTKVLPRCYDDDALTYDVYHFRNKTTNEWLTVCLDNYRERTEYVLMQKGRVMASVEDIDKMEPFPYPAK
ncbi:hypothetical protein AAVH_07414 [Aphelenchoides avenae]